MEEVNIFITKDKLAFILLHLRQIRFSGPNTDKGVLQSCEFFEELEDNLLPNGLFVVKIRQQGSIYRVSRATTIFANAFGILEIVYETE